MTAPKLTARQVITGLYEHFAGRWAFLTEVSARPDYGQRPSAVNTYRRIDVLLLRANKAIDGGIERLAIEVKVTRPDFHQDVRNPDKQAPWRELAHRHAYAVPEGLVADAEVPGTSGLLVVRPGQYPAATWVRRAPRPTGHNPGPMPLQNLMDAFWRASRAEAQIKGIATGRDDTGEETPEQLRAEVLRLRHELDLAAGRLAREVEHRQQWQRRYAAHGSPPCGTCGRPLRPSRRRDTEWNHPDPTDAALCEAARRAQAATENEALPESRRMGRRFLYVPDPEPAELPASPTPEEVSK